MICPCFGTCLLDSQYMEPEGLSSFSHKLDTADELCCSRLEICLRNGQGIVCCYLDLMLSASRACGFCSARGDHFFSYFLPVPNRCTVGTHFKTPPAPDSIWVCFLEFAGAHTRAILEQTTLRVSKLASIPPSEYCVASWAALLAAASAVFVGMIALRVLLTCEWCTLPGARLLSSASCKLRSSSLPGSPLQ